MNTIAAHTLGCKVNQYDTQAMLELFQKEGFRIVPIHDKADVYLVNTCTVTGVGDRKSMQMIRRLRREHPEARIIVCGCMAQLLGDELLETGADLILGTQNRLLVVDLLRQAVLENRRLCAVTPLTEAQTFEPLCVSSQADRTRAVIKIQEGCRNRCSYCIIPSVRGPIRSRPLEEIRLELSRLAAAGFREVVLTGIHLSSYGRETASSLTLKDVLQAVEDQDGIQRVRLGSLEPGIASDDFTSALKRFSKLCPQFHLALQSGSDTVLARMRRQYNAAQYLRAVERLRNVFPSAALTTDILTGFPGETEAEFHETADMIERVGFARIHVFPYSQRPGTPAASMPDQIPVQVREERARALISLGRETALKYLTRWVGKDALVLPETLTDGQWEGYTPEYIRVRLDPDVSCTSGTPVRVTLFNPSGSGMRGRRTESGSGSVN